MKTRLISSVLTVASVLTAAFLIPLPVAGQAPRTHTNNWEPPRTPDGQPDMQGIWAYHGYNWGRELATEAERAARPRRVRAPSYSIEEGGIAKEVVIEGKRTRIASSLVVDPPDGKVPYQSWAAAKYKETYENHTDRSRPEWIDPQSRCFLDGAPRHTYQEYAFQILQSPGYVVMLYEYTHAYRIIPLDGRQHLPGSIKLFNGDSRGHWEGKTLVVDVTNQNEKTWLDVVGTFHSDALHVVERYTFVDANTINYEATIEDPKVYTRPWKLGITLSRNTEKGYELIEYACWEGEPRLQELVR